MNSEPKFPKRDEIQFSLLNEIIKRGGAIDFSRDGRELEIILAAKFGISNEDRDFAAANYNSEGHRKWRNEIQFVRDELVKSGHLSNKERKIWALTAMGYELCDEEVPEHLKTPN